MIDSKEVWESAYEVECNGHATLAKSGSLYGISKAEVARLTNLTKILI
ncbi:hypothetical protein [Holospora undulata]|uniref:Uncharacterized protein n=1 Tax=Holospora undulata HU1 TaxID=1321371 RepID=A0A061JI51_9PROT|nr:hypothetical protein [Holospora undulata]ETZ05168.1 hypothetical protein K737_300397 [Holospora undulata HU1]